MFSSDSIKSGKSRNARNTTTPLLGPAMLDPIYLPGKTGPAEYGLKVRRKIGGK